MFFDSLLLQEQKHHIMKNLYKLFTVLLLMIISASQAFAQIKDGEATVNQGGSTTVSIGAAYQSTLNRATSINYTWTAGSSAISIQSKTNKTLYHQGQHSRVGETIQLSATAYPTNATNRSLNWTTENYSVASVSNSGLVTARAPIYVATRMLPQVL